MIESLLGDDVESSGRYLTEVIYGANDGIVTTFAVVSGVAGAALNPSIVLILGLANRFADGFSMWESAVDARTWTTIAPPTTGRPTNPHQTMGSRRDGRRSLRSPRS